MRLSFPFVCACAVVVTTLLAVAPPSDSRQLPCLSSASPEQRSRRSDAVRYVRLINSLQVQQFARSKRYADVTIISNQLQSAPPPGFDLQLVSMPNAYALLLTDGTDPCGSALVSSNAGLIYEAQALR
jgi:hypothetical protein